MLFRSSRRKRVDELIRKNYEDALHTLELISTKKLRLGADESVQVVVNTISGNMDEEDLDWTEDDMETMP